MDKKINLYTGQRFAAEIISHAVWLYFRFTLSFRDAEELRASRGVIVSYEAIRQWTLKFGQTYANTLRRQQPKRGDKWHLDEVALTINGELSDQLTRHKNGRCRRFKSPRQAQQFLSAHAHINNLFRVRHRHPTALAYRAARSQAFATWQEVSCAHSVA
jgi:transposase-like protein